MKSRKNNVILSLEHKSFIKLLLTALIVLQCIMVNSQEVGCLYEIEKPIKKSNYKELNIYFPYKYYSCYNTSFEKGFALKKTNKNNHGEVSFELNKKYCELSFIIDKYYIENSDIINSIFIIGDDKIIKEIKLNLYYGPVPFHIDVTNISTLKIKLDEITSNNLMILFLDPKLYATPQFSTSNKSETVYDSIKLIENIKPNSYINKFNIISNLDNKLSFDMDYIDIEGKRYYSGLLYHRMIDVVYYLENDIFCTFDLKTNYKYLEFIAGPLSSKSSFGTAKLSVLGDNNVILSHVFKGGDRCIPFSLDISGYSHISFILDSLLLIPDFAIADIKVFSSKQRYNIEPDIKDTISNGWYDVISNTKLVSFYSLNSRERLFYNNNEKNRQIIINGKKYSNGFILYRGDERYYYNKHHNFERNIGSSYATFLLNYEYDSIRFNVGWIQNNPTIGKDTLSIYADDKILKQIILHPLMENECSMEIPDCEKLSFILKGNDLLPQAGYGIVELLAHKKSNKNTATQILMEQSTNVQPNKIPYFYVTNKADLKVNKPVFYNMTDIEYVVMNNGDSVVSGIELNPKKWHNNMLDINSKFSSSYFASSYYSPILIHYDYQDSININNYHTCVQYDKYGNVYSHAYACYNTYNSYDSIQFTIGVSLGNNFGNYENTNLDSTIYNKLYVICDGVITSKVNINNKMAPKSITLPTHKCSKLLFWIPCTNQNTYPYIIYNMKYLCE